jgi:hypothetical protein
MRIRRRTDQRSDRCHGDYALRLPAVLRSDSATAKHRIVDGISSWTRTSERRAERAAIWSEGHL